MLIGLVVVTLSEWDRIRRRFGFDPPRDVEMAGALDILYKQTGWDEQSWAYLQNILQQAARDGKIMVWAKVGLFDGSRSTNLSDTDGVYELVDPVVFRTMKFETHGRWVIGRKWGVGNQYYFDPMFNRSQIRALAQRLCESGQILGEHSQ